MTRPMTKQPRLMVGLIKDVHVKTVVTGDEEERFLRKELELTRACTSSTGVHLAQDSPTSRFVLVQVPDKDGSIATTNSERGNTIV